MSTKAKTEIEPIESAGGVRSEPVGRAEHAAGGAPPAGVGFPRVLRERLSEEVIDQLLAGARSEEEIVGPGGVLAQLTKRLVERALAAELTEHLGYESHQEPPGGVGNTRNGSTPKTLQTEQGLVEIRTPRDRNGSFEPQLVRKGQRRFEGFDDKILALYSRGCRRGTSRRTWRRGTGAWLTVPCARVGPTRWWRTSGTGSSGQSTTSTRCSSSTGSRSRSASARRCSARPATSAWSSPSRVTATC